MSLAEGNMSAGSGKAPLEHANVAQSVDRGGNTHPKSAEIIDFSQHLLSAGRTTANSRGSTGSNISPDGWWVQGGKRLFDMAFSVAGILLFLPAFLLIAVAIKFSSPGPVLYRQLRLGKDGQPFQMIKFRTMLTCDKPGTVIRQTTSGDTRVFAIGRILRRTSLDELPQLFNVLCGHMSIVGPRPHAPLTAVEDTYFEIIASEPQYQRRYDVRPGITGLAQVSGSRGPILTRDGARKRLNLDVEYVIRQSFLTDAKILARTIAREFVSGKAH